MQVINIQKQDKNGLTFTPDDFAVGGQIEIKNVGNDDYLLGTVTAIVDGGPKSVQITFNRNNASGQASGDQTIKTVTAPQPYVNTTGDSMTGDLKMRDNAQIQFIDPVGSPTLIRAGREDAQYPLIFDLRHPGGSTAGGYDIKVQGNSSYNSLRFTNAKGSAFEINGGGGATFGSVFKMNVSLDNNKIVKLGNATDDTDAVPYGQVKQELQDKFNEYVETISFGTYTYTVSNNPPEGYFAAYTTNGSQTEHRPAAIRQLWISKNNKAGDDIGLASLSPGDLIRFANGVNLYQFRVNGTPADQGTWVKIDVNKGTGPSDLTVSNDFDITLIKLTGGSVNLDDYLKLDGSSTMTGDLDLGNKKIEKVLGIDFGSNASLTNNGSTKLKIKNASVSTDGNAQVEITRPADSRRGFAIRGSDEDKSNEFDMLYSYHNPSGASDRVLYRGSTTSDNAIQTKASVLELIASGGIGGDGGSFNRHGAYHYKPGVDTVAPGEFTSDNTKPKLIKQFTFNKKNRDGEDDLWNELATGEVITVVQSSGDNYLVINYTVNQLLSFSTAFIVDVSAHQTVIAYSDGFYCLQSNRCV